MLIVQLIVCLVVALNHCCSAANILVLLPHYGYSHFKVYYPVLQSLAQRNHTLTVVAYIPNPQPHPNYEELLLKGKEFVNTDTLDMYEVSRSLKVLFMEYVELHHEGQESCRLFYESGHVETVLAKHAKKPYELIITEFFNSDCQMGLAYLLQLPVVGMSSCALMPWLYDRILLPDTPSYVQSEFIGFPLQLSWQQRFVNFVQSRGIKLLYSQITNYYDSQLIRKYLHVDVDVAEFVKSSTSLMLVNQHYSYSGSRPQTPQLIEIGGIHINETQIHDQMPAHIEAFLQSAKEGAVLISWGSMLRATSVNPAKIQAMINSLEKLPYKVIWKWESSELPTKNKQFLFVKWLPQLRLLCDVRIKFFWSHGGLLGTTEAVHCAKPVLVTPIYGDQFTNAHALSNRRAGVIIDYNDLDEQNLQVALQEISRPRYAENAQLLSTIFRERPDTPLNTAVWWIEHLLQHGKTGTEFLQTKAVHLHWFVYYSLDSILIIIAAGIFFVYAIKFLAGFLIKQMCGSSGKRSKDINSKKKKN